MTSRSPAANRQSLLWLAFAAICAAGAALVWYASAWGVGVSPDSAEYLAAARHLHSLADLFTLPTQWAPGYPVLLKIFSFAGSDIFASTRVLQCLLMAGNLAAAMLLLQHVAGRASVSPLIGGLVLLCGFPLWEVNFYAWSEAPFLLCQQLSALALLRFLAEPVQLRLLFAAAALTAAALLFRYAGIAWVGTAALCVLLMSPPPWPQRWRNALWFGFTAVLPFALWLLANKLVRNETTNRSLVVHWVNGTDLLTLLAQIFSWFGLTGGWLLFIAGAGLAIAIWSLALRGNTPPARLRQLLWICLAQVVIHGIFIVLSKSLFDAYIPFDERIFISAWLFTLLALAAAAMQVGAQGGRRLGVAVATALVFAVIGGWQLLPKIRQVHERGEGYLGAYMLTQVSKVEELQGLAGRTLYSNAPDYLRMRTDFVVHDYPRKFAPTTQLVNPEYQNELAAMLHSVQGGNAVLVHYQGFEWRQYFPGLDELKQLGYQEGLSGAGVTILIAGTASEQTPAANR